MIFLKHAIETRDTTPMDLAPVAFNMRQADKNEIWASHLLTPLPALEMGLKFSKICKTVFRHERPIAIYGVVPNPEMGGTASVWMLGTDALFQIRTCFGKTSRMIIASLLEVYPFLYNYVDVRNTKSIAWLKACGAQFADPAPYGVSKLPFVFFQLRKGV